MLDFHLEMQKHCRKTALSTSEHSKKTARHTKWPCFLQPFSGFLHFWPIDIEWVEQTSIYIELGFQIWVDRISQQTKNRPRCRFRCKHLASVFSTQSECNGSRLGAPLGDHDSVVLAWPSAQQWDLFTAEGLRSLAVFFWQPSVSKAVLREGLPRKWQDSGDGTIRVSGWRCEDSRLNQGYQSRLYLSRFTFYLKIHKCQDNRK